jgi:septum formation protein
MTSPQLERLARSHRIILGSGSPRRVKLLGDMGIRFEQVIPSVDETSGTGEDPFEYAERLARDKARWVSEREHDALVIGCDTVVALDGTILDKPSDAEQAFRTLSTLAGRQHVVGTAVALAKKGELLVSGIEKTAVRFNEVSERAIREYIASGEPMDKAGAYGIQGMGAFLVDSIEGPLDNVIGLPRKLLEELSSGLLKTLTDSADGG